jgi:hypothetical protein
VNKTGRPLRAIPMKNIMTDCSRALELIVELRPTCLLANKTDDSDEIVHFITTQEIAAMIPLKINRKANENMTKRFTKWPLKENFFFKIKE